LTISKALDTRLLLRRTKAKLVDNIPSFFL